MQAQAARTSPLDELTRRTETRDQMEERHYDEWELVHGAYGVEELPSELHRRHAEERAGFEAWEQPAFSFESIKRDPWTAVYLPAPENGSPALLNAAYNAAARCIEAIDQRGREFRYADAITHGPLIPQGNDADVRARAEMRRDELHARLYPIGAPAAGRERRERIASLEDMARTAGQEILRPDFPTGPGGAGETLPPAPPEPHRPDFPRIRPGQPKPGRYEELKPAPREWEQMNSQDRNAEPLEESARDFEAIGEALKTRDQPLTFEAIAQNPWHAVTRDLGPGASAELSAEVARVTDELWGRAVDWGNRAGVGGPAENSKDREFWFDIADLAEARAAHAASTHERAEARAASIEDLGRLEKLEGEMQKILDLPVNDHGERTVPPGFLDEAREALEPAVHGRYHGAFLSPEFVARSVSAHTARTVEMMLGVVLGYFVDEPAMTPEQSRLAGLARAERAEVMGFEIARRENAAALDTVNTEIDRHRPHIAPEELAQPGSEFERYPGVTRDLEADYERGREAERSRDLSRSM